MKCCSRFKTWCFRLSWKATGLTATTVNADGATVAGATFTLVRGGAVNDNFVVFAKARLAEAIKVVDMLNLAAEFAVTADGPGGITRMVANEALPSAVPGIRVSMTHVNPDAVKVVRALKETVTLPSPTATADAVRRLHELRRRDLSRRANSAHRSGH